ncbi:MAG TPA: nitronate monooxygenase [Deltaproteobacteria bacterium]|nr:nitronate monooxygenase [Deltaproteobacteria bacterium]
MKRIRTALTDMLEIAYPVIGAPMFLISYEDLAVAVSEAGGLGTIPLPNYRTIEALETGLSTIRTRTNKPIGVNIHLSGRFPWKEQLTACLNAGVSFFITSLGDPRLILQDVHANGGKVFADVVTLKQALNAAERSVDGLIAVSEGAGGHAGTIPVMVFVPYITSRVDLPVIAAGGISTGAQMAAALALGACGVVVGTRLIATPEAQASDAYKQALIAAGPEDIVFTDRVTGNPANWLAHSIQDFDTRPEIGSKRWLDLWSAGKSVAQVDDIKPAGAIIEELVCDYQKSMESLPPVQEDV